MLNFLKKLDNRFGRNSNVQVLHHHIPKTAGTTFNSLLDSLYPSDKIMPKRWLQSVSDDPNIGKNRHVVAFQRFRLIHAHTNLLPEVPEDWIVVTFLRPPVRRVVSVVSDWARLEDKDVAGLPNHNREVKQQARSASIGDLLDIDAPLVRQHLCNGMCKSLLSRIYTGAAIDAMNDEELTNCALAVLRSRMDFVGDAVRFDEWLNVFSSEVYGRTFPERTDNRSGAASRYEALDSEERKKIEAFNTADLALYERYTGQFGWTNVKRSDLNKDE
ncbi:MAG: hypothetical protein ACQERP_08895 [Pseudomonadota bacterium]